MSKTVIRTELLCPYCRNITTIFRKAARQKEKGHLKKLYCYKCKTTHNHIELGEQYTEKDIEKLLERRRI